MNTKDSTYYKACKSYLLCLLLEYCDERVLKETIKYVDNDFFHVISAQLYRSYIEGCCGEGYLTEEQIFLVKKFVRGEWDGTPEHFEVLFKGD